MRLHVFFFPIRVDLTSPETQRGLARWLPQPDKTRPLRRGGFPQSGLLRLPDPSRRARAQLLFCSLRSNPFQPIRSLPTCLPASQPRTTSVRHATPRGRGSRGEQALPESNKRARRRMPAGSLPSTDLSGPDRGTMDRDRVIDLSGAEIRGDLEGRNPPIFLPRQPAAAPLVALDIGGALLWSPTSFSVVIPPWLLTVRGA
jgi:hypothetical protein